MAEHIDTSMKYIVDDFKELKPYRVKIQNVASGLWACAPVPPQGSEVYEYPVVVESDSFKLQYDSYDVWTVAYSNYSKHHYYIYHPATNDKYAWVSKPGTKGENVKLTIHTRIWKITHVGDGKYKIAPIGEQEKYLFWTDVSSTPGQSITLANPKNDTMLWRFRDVNEGAQGDNLTSVVEIQHVPCKLLATVLPPLGDEGDTDIPVSVAPETALRPFCQTWKLMKVDQDWVNHSGVFHGDRIYEGDIIRKVVHHDYVIQNVHSGLYAWHAEQAEEDIEVFQRQEPRVWTIIRVAGDHYTIAPAGKQQDELFWTVHGREYPVDNSDQVRLEKPSGIQQHWIIRAVQRDFIPQSEAT